jgi:hypothetical protein
MRAESISDDVWPILDDASPILDDMRPILEDAPSLRYSSSVPRLAQRRDDLDEEGEPC